MRSELFKVMKLELSFLLGGRRERLGWFIRTLVVSIAVIWLGPLMSLDLGDLRYVHASSPGLWLLLSAMMLDNLIKVRENDLIEILLQVYGSAYLRARYWFYLAVTYLSSLLLVIILHLITSLLAGFGFLEMSIPLLITLPFMGSVTFTTATTVVSVKVEGLKLLDTFSEAGAGLMILLLFVTLYLLEVLSCLAYSVVLLVASIMLAFLTDVYLSRHDFPALLTV